MLKMNVDFSKFKNRLKIYAAVGVVWTTLGMLYVQFGFPHTPYESPALGYPLHSVLYWLSIGGLFVFLFLYFIPQLLFIGFLLNIGQTTLIGELIYRLKNMVKK